MRNNISRGLIENFSKKLGDPVFQSRLSIVVVLLLNLYFLNIFVNLSYIIRAGIIQIILFILILLWFIGIAARKIYLSSLYYVLVSGLLVYEKAVGPSIFTTAVIASIWLLLSYTFTDVLLKRSIRRRHLLSIKALLLSITIIGGIYATYLFISYIVASTVIYVYSYIESVTPSIFQTFYEVFISTHVGSLILFSLIIFVIYYIIDNYITGLISDTLFLNIDFAINRIRTLVYSQAHDLLKGKDPFQKIYVRSILFVVFFYIYGLLYPVISIIRDIIQITWLSYIVWITVWFVVSTIIYRILRDRFLNILIPRQSLGFKALKITNNIRSRRGLYLSLTLLFLYIGFIYVVDRNPSVIMDLLFTSLGLKPPTYMGGRSQATIIISRLYTVFCNNLIYYIENYFYSIEEAYSMLSKLLRELIVFLWG
ncbi:hypothetical protein [Staphylothermus hellenicus]|uniref:Uncharacterized protein n=1 Tax=Staphylothermus hellenicus (strain DSM 12710 / JCM 10830 / BK20S6-10-b1 / P8) TaxID=591019 RepID=D7DBE8_STAHD|nr:hypothetical protein [Staphylothermus hellenicus]ADI31495.1 hypothetical protein Shell_0363 [Staphylothermus hellenicus DSM 12710]